MNPLVSIVVPTKNSQRHLERCLISIRKQTHTAIELIVIDNFSSDTTGAIASKYADAVYKQGPERSAQRNKGAQVSQGEYVLFVDSDMELSVDLVEKCIQAHADAVIIPEEAIGRGFWAACKKLEKRLYQGSSSLEAARFFRKDFFVSLTGYNEALISGEDWEITARARRRSAIGRADAVIYHNEGRPTLRDIAIKKFYYGRHFRKYIDAMPRQNVTTMVLHRYSLFFKHIRLLLNTPLVAAGLIYMKTIEFISGGLGYVLARKSTGTSKKTNEKYNTVDFFRSTNPNRCLLLGYYGAGNFGDELIAETIFAAAEHFWPTSRMTVGCLSPKTFSRLHPTARHKVVSMKNPLALFWAGVRSSSIVIGGGGLWTKDSGGNLISLGMFLVLMRYVFRKPVHLVGVGFYDVANFSGKIGGFLAGISANTIIVRDHISWRNFRRFHEEVVLGEDIALSWLLKHSTPTNSPDTTDVLSLSDSQFTVIISPRFFKDSNTYYNRIITMVSQGALKDYRVIILRLEPYKSGEHAAIDRKLMTAARKAAGVTYHNWNENPVSLLQLLRNHSDHTCFIGPQYHGQVAAHISGVPFLPMTYFNKCDEMLYSLGYDTIHSVEHVTQRDIISFIETHSHVFSRSRGL